MRTAPIICPPTTGCARTVRRSDSPRLHLSFSALIVQFVNGLAGASSLFLVAAGLTLIFGVTRIVNFAHGSLYMLGAYIAYSAIVRFGTTIPGYWLAVLAAAIVVGAIGVLIEMLLLRRLYAAPELLQLIATFGVVLIVKDATLALWGPEDLHPRFSSRCGGSRGERAGACWCARRPRTA
jgi:branched-subunit amino acid ABC-type transport system permease component